MGGNFLYTEFIQINNNVVCTCEHWAVQLMMPIPCVLSLFNLPHILEVLFISPFSGRLLSLFWQSLLIMLTWQGIPYYMYSTFVWPRSSTADFTASGTTTFSVSGTTTSFGYSGTFSFGPSPSFGQATIPSRTTTLTIGRFSHYISTEFGHYILLQIKFTVRTPQFTGTKKPASHLYFLSCFLTIGSGKCHYIKTWENW